MDAKITQRVQRLDKPRTSQVRALIIVRTSLQSQGFT